MSSVERFCRSVDGIRLSLRSSSTETRPDTSLGEAIRRVQLQTRMVQPPHYPRGPTQRCPTLSPLTSRPLGRSEVTHQERALAGQGEACVVPADAGVRDMQAAVLVAADDVITGCKGPRTICMFQVNSHCGAE